MNRVVGILTVGVIFSLSLSLTSCMREGKERARPRMSRDLKREILEIQTEQLALKREFDIQVDSGGSRVHTANIYGWHAKSPELKATIKARLKRFVKTCNKILEDATEPSLKGKVNVRDFMNARENAKAYLKSLRESEEENNPKKDDDKPRRGREPDEDD